ncbi:hypothetical protein [Weissella sp. MSCH1]|uniref:Thoeris anti-defense Tad2 family protein n=1 Tax=Weissella sp. MSCH1 TaxID=3383343 RepID=UPI003896A986
MYLHEAVKKAMESGEGLTRPNNETLYIPTNTMYGILVVIGNDTLRITLRWQPNADDLVANDWQVTPGATTNQVLIGLKEAQR